MADFDQLGAGMQPKVPEDTQQTLFTKLRSFSNNAQQLIEPGFKSDDLQSLNRIKSQLLEGFADYSTNLVFWAQQNLKNKLEAKGVLQSFKKDFQTTKSALESLDSRTIQPTMLTIANFTMSANELTNAVLSSMYQSNKSTESDYKSPNKNENLEETSDEFDYVDSNGNLWRYNDELNIKVYIPSACVVFMRTLTSLDSAMSNQLKNETKADLYVILEKLIFVTKELLKASRSTISADESKAFLKNVALLVGKVKSALNYAPEERSELALMDEYEQISESLLDAIERIMVSAE